MYSIYADDVCIYNDTFLLDDQKLVNPKLKLSDSGAGSLQFKMPPTNVGYNFIEKLITDIVVKKDDVEIWAGRVLSEDKDFYNNRVLFCEGELAFFNDTTQPPAEYHDISVRAFLEALVDVHNSKVAVNRQFTVGTVTVMDPNDSLYRYTNYESTMKCINDKLVDRLGGHLRVRKENGVRYLDYLAEYPNTNSQVIEFGVNLLDFSRNWDASKYATVIIPLGERLEESPIDALYAYLTVADVNDGSIYVKSDAAVAEFGWIEKVVNWDDVTTPTALLRKGQQYLSDLQFDDMDIELSALDLHYLDVNYEAVKLLDQIRVISRPHGMDRYFPVTKLEIPLDHPENTMFTLGDKVKISLTERSNAANTKLKENIDTLPIPKTEDILEQAKSDATDIMNIATNGYVTITKDANGTEALYVSDAQDYTHATKLWKWSINGLGYSNDGGQTWGLAITMNGAIVADYITAGTFNADLIKTGKIQDQNQNVVFDLEAGKLTIKSGAINLGNGNFSVDNSGYLTSNSGKIGPFTINYQGIFSSRGCFISSSAFGFYYEGDSNDRIFSVDYSSHGTDEQGHAIIAGVALTAGYRAEWVGIYAEHEQTPWHTSIPILLYVNHDNDYGIDHGDENTLNAFVDFDMHNHYLKRATTTIDDFVIEDGASGYYNAGAYQLHFVRGLLADTRLL